MVKVTPFILSLVIILFSGCGKSMEDVSGVYETKEIKTPIDGTRSWHHSTKWILDLSESGKFTLKQEKFRVPTQDKKYSPVPMTGVSSSGDWEATDERIRLAWTGFIAPEATEQRGGQVNLVLDLYLQENSDLVAELLDASWDDLGQNEFDEFDPDLYLIQKNYTVDGLRFVRQR